MSLRLPRSSPEFISFNGNILFNSITKNFSRQSKPMTARQTVKPSFSQSRTFPVHKDQCLSSINNKTTKRSLTDCGISCLNDDICRSAEFDPRSKSCWWSNSASLTNCTWKEAATPTGSGVLTNLVCEYVI